MPITQRTCFPSPSWVMICYWKTFKSKKKSVSNKPHTLPCMFTLKDLSLHSCFTLNLFFLDLSFIPLNSPFQIFIEPNKINQKKYDLQFKPPNSKRQRQTQYEKKFRNNSTNLNSIWNTPTNQFQYELSQQTDINMDF